MKRKPVQPTADPVISVNLLAQAKKMVEPDSLKHVVKCVVCGGDCNVQSAGEQLCWVCRRLKISAWRDADQQMPAQE